MASKDTNSHSNTYGISSIHEMFHIVGDQMTQKDVKVLKLLYSAILSRNYLDKIKDGYTFLVALEKIGRLDESNFKHILHLLWIINRHDLTHYVTLRKRQTVEADPVDEYLEQTARSNTITPFKRKAGRNSLVKSSKSSKCEKSVSSHESCSTSTIGHAESSTSALSNPESDSESPAAKRPRRSPKELKAYEVQHGHKCSSSNGLRADIKTKRTCDIRLRVRAEYCQHDSALEGNVHSNKPDVVERQFEKFMQANTILKSRDLGSIICDIKFSELTYLDAFWRDYINGSLLDALKGVFITESLKQAVGHEAIKLLVNVDEDDYEKGRLSLLNNLKQ